MRSCGRSKRMAAILSGGRRRAASGALGLVGPLHPDVFLPGQHPRLKGAEPAREHETEPAHERKGGVHLGGAQHLQWR